MEEQEMRPPEESAAAEESESRGGGAGATISQELKQAVREAALEVLGPAARQATSSAAKYAVGQAPGIVTKNVLSAVSKAGGPDRLAAQAVSKGGEALSGLGGIAGLAGKLISKLRGGGGGAATGWGHNRRMPVQQLVYCSVSVRHAYDGWTEYKQWPRYMHRANQADAQVTEQEARIKVTEKMWGFKRPFTAEVVTQKPDEHIKWNATEGVKHTGVINFHELGPRLTLIEVNVDHAPSGPLEKIARGARFVKRAVRADFHRFQAWIEMKSDDELAEIEGWRGTIEAGRIVKSHEDALEEERREAEGPQQPEGEYEEPEPGEEKEEEGEEGVEEAEAEPGEEEEPYEEEEPGAAEREAPKARVGRQDQEHVGQRSGRTRTGTRPQTGSRTS